MNSILKEILSFSLVHGNLIKVACIFHEKIANLTALTVANNEMHFFIPNDADMMNSLELFVHLYSLRKEWYQEHWILDVTGSKSIDDYMRNLENLKLDLDDDLFLLTYSRNYKQYSKLNIWEYYEIHSSLARKVNFLGYWSSSNGLNITKIDKWTRRTNLEVCITFQVPRQYF